MNLLLKRRGPWVAAFLVACAQAGILRLRDSSWIGDQLWGQETIGVAQVLALPLIGAAAALAGWTDRTGLLTLFPGGRLRRRHVARALVAWGAVFAVPYLVANAVVIVASGTASLSVSNGSVWPVATQILGMGVAVTVGYAIGYFVRSWAAAIVAGALFALWILLDRMGAVTSGLAEYSSSGSLVGASASTSYFGTRVVWLLAVIAVAVWSLVASGRALRPVIGAGIGVLLLGGFLFPLNDSYHFLNKSAVHCSSSAVVVCGPVELAKRVDEGGQEASRVAAILQKQGVTTRARFELWTPQADSKDWILLVNPSRFRDRLSLYQVADGVAAPKSCKMWRSSTPPSAEMFAGEQMLTEYLLAQLSGTGNGASYDRLAKGIGKAATQQALLASATAFQECRPSVPPVLEKLTGAP